MEIKLITIALFIMLLLPPSLKESGLVWVVFAASIFTISFPEHMEKSVRQRMKNNKGGYKRCDSCGEMVKGHDCLCYHCKLEASYRAYKD